MKLFVSTCETQGTRPNDFCFVPDGELLTFGAFECTNEGVDDACGCARSLCGVKDAKGTTTMRVMRWPAGSRSRLVEEVRQAYIRAGFRAWWSDADITARATDCADRLIRAAAPLPIGAIVERCGPAVFTIRQGA